MAIRSDARLGGSIPQFHRVPETPGLKPLFHSQRDIALILDKTVKPGYGVLKAGTVMALCSITGKLYPYPQASALLNDTNAKAYLVADAGSAATVLYTTIEDSYKFQVADELILDGDYSGVIEVQSMDDATPAQNDVYVLTHTASGTILTTAALGATPDSSDVLAGLIGGANVAAYAAAPFTLADDTTKLTITWKAVGVQTLAVGTKTVGTSVPTITQTTAGTAYDATLTDAENLGAIVSIDRTAVNSTQAEITFTTAITNYANFTTAKYANLYVKSDGVAATPFAEAKSILDADIDTGTGEFAVGALTSTVISNAVLYTASLIGLDAAAITDLGTVTDGRFTILK